MSDRQKTIMLVDDQALNLTIGKNLLKDLYKVYTIPSAELLLNLLETVTPDLILLDVMMPVMSGYETVGILKANPKLAQIPVIFLTACSDEESELKGLSLGAIDYIMKPFSAPLLRKRIENQLLAEEHKKSLQMFNDNLSEMLRQKTDNVIYLQNAMLVMLADMMEFRDEFYAGHALKTQKYMEVLLDAMQEEGVYPQEFATLDKYECASGAKFHDIGKIFISDAILNKGDTLTGQETEIMKTHVYAGLQMISKLEMMVDDSSMIRHARQIIGGHHEKWDGTGYPAGLKGLDIPLEGRLMAIADQYDELVSPRPYKEPLSFDEARAFIEKGSGTSFDPELVRLFIKVSGCFEDAAKEDSG
ncbi:MAG: response regulator [Oscillospiraceae bacterium]|jgi:putative two-component system response regulator|nr:response regulator [Oscillospiraceae bacterium]